MGDTDSTTLKTPKMKFLLCFGIVSIVLLAGGDAASTGIEKANPTFDAIRSALSVRDALSKISDLLDKASEELSEDFIDYSECQPFCGYTFFAPTNAAYESVLVADASDPFEDSKFRKEFILSLFHLEERLNRNSIDEMVALKMANSKLITVGKNDEGTIMLNDHVTLLEMRHRISAPSSSSMVLWLMILKSKKPLLQKKRIRNDNASVLTLPGEMKTANLDN